MSGPAGPAPRDPQADPAAELLARILEKTEAYCRRLGRVSLDFVCRERIDERQYDPPRLISAALTSGAAKHVTRVSLEYDYQLIRKGDVIEETRTLLKEGDKPRNEPEAALKTKLYKHRYLVFGPGGLLGEFWQPKHSYTYLGEETVDGEKAYVIEASPAGPAEPGLVIEASPAGPQEPGLVYGKAWIRKQGISPSSGSSGTSVRSGTYDKVLQMAEAIGHQAEPRISVVGFYGDRKERGPLPRPSGHPRGLPLDEGDPPRLGGDRPLRGLPVLRRRDGGPLLRSNQGELP